MLISRIRNALRTNDAQLSSVTLFTAMNMLAIGRRGEGVPVWVYAVAFLFWPSLAFIGNLIDPIPKEQI